MKIENIEQLKVEKLRLENDILIAKGKLTEDIKMLQAEIQPVRQMVDVSKNLFVESNRNSSLVNIGLDLGVDMLLRNTILSNSSWLVRLAVPFFAKNLLSNYVDKNKDEIVNQSVTWFNEKTKPENTLQLPKATAKKGLLEKSLLWVKKVTSEKPTEMIEHSGSQSKLAITTQ